VLALVESAGEADVTGTRGGVQLMVAECVYRALGDDQAVVIRPRGGYTVYHRKTQKDGDASQAPE
jgi:hypothetical protein